MGFDTVRYWEIPYSGSALISRRPKTLIPNNLKDLKHHIEYVIEDPATTLKMGEEVREFVMKYHSPESRAKTIINALTR